MKHTFKTSGTCSQFITFELDGDKVKNVLFLGGCNGNLKAISKLVDGLSVDYIEGKLKGNTCGPRPTSCGDQLAIAIRQAYEEEQRAKA